MYLLMEYPSERTREDILHFPDYTDKVGYARGKQCLDPHGMWYTAQSGIWQTVWMEWVPNAYVTNMKITPDIDRNRVDFIFKVSEMK